MLNYHKDSYPDSNEGVNKGEHVAEVGTTSRHGGGVIVSEIRILQILISREVFRRFVLHAGGCDRNSRNDPGCEKEDKEQSYATQSRSVTLFIAGLNFNGGDVIGGQTLISPVTGAHVLKGGIFRYISIVDGIVSVTCRVPTVVVVVEPRMILMVFRRAHDAGSRGSIERAKNSYQENGTHDGDKSSWKVEGENACFP